MRDMTPHPSAMKLRGNRPDTLQLMSAIFSFSKLKNTFAKLHDFVCFLILKVVVFDEIFRCTTSSITRDAFLLSVNAYGIRLASS